MFAFKSKSLFRKNYLILFFITFDCYFESFQRKNFAFLELIIKKNKPWKYRLSHSGCHKQRSCSVIIVSLPCS